MITQNAPAKLSKQEKAARAIRGEVRNHLWHIGQKIFQMIFVENLTPSETAKRMDLPEAFVIVAGIETAMLLVRRIRPEVADLMYGSPEDDASELARLLCRGGKGYPYEPAKSKSEG